MAAARPYTDAERGPRLQKVLAEAGVGSRRACEQMIEDGLVTINGKMVASLPAWVDPARDRIVVDGKRIGRPEAQVYLMLFKPRGIMATNHDPEGRKRAIDLIDHPMKPRLYCVGRLDMDSSGLLLMTNDGALANRLAHPRYEVHRVYEVTVRGSLSAEDITRIEEGIWLYDRNTGRGSKTRRARLKLLKRDRERTRLRMELREGRNRQIRRMMLELGHPVKRLRRIEMGPLRLKGLRVGEWRPLTSDELRALKRAAYGKKDRGPRSKRARGKVDASANA